jgi:hypothetical protein
MRRSAAALLIAFVLTAPALADGWKKLDGEMAPALSAKDWLNAEGSGPTLAGLRGKVWLLEFFSTG